MSCIIYTVETVFLSTDDETGEITDNATGNITPEAKSKDFDDLDEALQDMERAGTPHVDSGMGWYTSGDSNDGDSFHYCHGTHFITGEHIIKSLFMPDNAPRADWEKAFYHAAHN